jgi:cell division protein FtsW
MARVRQGGRSVQLAELDCLLLAVVVLCCLGLVMAVSINGPREVGRDAAQGVLLAMQAQGWKLLFGVVALVGAASLPLHLLRRWAWPLFLTALGLCLTAAVLGHVANGATRWLRLGSFSFQPVELARFLLIVVSAAALADAGLARHGFWRGFAPVMGAAAALAGALLLQPDVGNALIVLTLATAVALFAGVRVRWFVLCGLPLLWATILLAGNRGHVHDRIAGFLEARPGTQVHQSILAIGSGGVWGQGLGNGWMKMGFVPEANNDFVFAMIGEELGLWGALLVVALFGVIGGAGLRLVLRIEDAFARYLVFGLVVAICMQATINLLVVTGMAPAKGIDLPFLSSGGTNLVFSLAAIGMIGNAARSHAGAPLHGRDQRWVS